MNKKNRRWLLLISILATISFLIILFFSISEIPEPEIPERPIPRWYGPFIMGLRGSHPIPIHILLIPSVLLIVAIIPISYYFISQRLEKKLENNMIVISKLIKKNNSVSTESITEKDNKNIILKFLNPSERKVIEKLIETKGSVLQSEISRAEGMTKLKTHRAVKDLERKGIIERESYGKTHRIILSKDIKDLMFKS
jgi:DNA-binding MarR family transcriptional regulator